MMKSQPTGTVTFLFTDVEGSTRQWDDHPDQMKTALARHDELLRGAIEIHDGAIFTTAGDAFCAAFSSPQAALDAAVDGQRSLHDENWGDSAEIAVRMALHTGNADERDGDYFGPPLNRCARLLATAHGDQIVVSLATQELLSDSLHSGVSLRDLGAHVLKDLERPEHIFQVEHPELQSEFPPLRSVDTATGDARLAEGRRSHEEGEWQLALDSLSELHRGGGLEAADVARLGEALYWLG